MESIVEGDSISLPPWDYSDHLMYVTVTLSLIYMLSLMVLVMCVCGRGFSPEDYKYVSVLICLYC